MAQIAPDILASVERFLAFVRQRLRIDAAYLYGSQATGSARPWSDIDVAVISPDFPDDLFQARVTLMQWAAAIDYATKTGQSQTPIAIEQLVLRLARGATTMSRTRP